MKKLTDDRSYCDVMMCDPEYSTCGSKGCRNKQIWDRLKAYEDTGLSPEEVQTLIRRLGGVDREHSGLLED